MSLPDTAAASIDPRGEAFVQGFSRFLLDRSAIDELALRRAERAQRQSGERFDLVLTRLGLVSEAVLVGHLAAFLRLEILPADTIDAVPPLPDGVELTFVTTHRIVPIADTGEGVTVAIADPFQADALSALAYLLGRPIVPRLTTEAEIQRLIDRAQGSRVQVVVESSSESADTDDVRRLTDLASEAPVIRLVHNLITRAIEAQASDIHIEPREDCLRVRYRLDGMLHTVEQLPPELTAAVTSRTKIMAGLDIAERRMPQDGRIRSVVQGRQIDLRVSTVPTLSGESVVLRILDRASIDLDYSALGFDPETRTHLRAMLARPHGMILVTGPTGSGKTTTLYTALKELTQEDNKVFTVEDPVEYQLPGINQIQVQPRIGLTFAHALRSILRQDPDIIMVGEIRDLETAEMAVQASLTGHLVLSTVHTNSAAATIARLTDMGVERFLLASALKGVLAQRLVRRLCNACALPSKPGAGARAVFERAGLSCEAVEHDGLMRTAEGCKACRQTGYRGRLAITELLAVNDRIREGIHAQASERDLEELARAAGMTSMFASGLQRVCAGQTTLEEVVRVTQVE